MSETECTLNNTALSFGSEDIGLLQQQPTPNYQLDGDLLDRDSSGFEKLEVSMDDDEEYKELKRRFLSIKIYRLQLQCRQMEVKLNLPPSKFTIDIYET